MRNIPIFNLDGRDDGDRIIAGPECVVAFEERVPITVNYDPATFLGWATLRRYRNQILMDLEFTDPRRFVREHRYVSVNMAVGGRFHSYSAIEELTLEGYIPLDSERRVREMTIEQISITNGANTDKRIGPWTAYYLTGEPNPEGGSIRDY